MRPTIPRATAEQIEKYIRGHEDFKEVISQRTPKQQERLRTKHPGRSARDYMTSEQTRRYLASLEAQEEKSKETRNLSITKGKNPLQELRRALNGEL